MSHVSTIRVRYAETDRMGVAHHGAYIPWLEEARIEYMRELGISYADLEAEGIFMPVMTLHIDYKRSLTFDQELDICTTVAIEGPCTIAFTSRMECDGTYIAKGNVIVACVDAHKRPVRIPLQVKHSLGLE